MKENRRLSDAIIGPAIMGSSITGVVSFFVTFSGGFVSASVCLVAAALSFGLLANAVLRQ